MYAKSSENSAAKIWPLGTVHKQVVIWRLVTSPNLGEFLCSGFLTKYEVFQNTRVLVFFNINGCKHSLKKLIKMQCFTCLLFVEAVELL